MRVRASTSRSTSRSPSDCPGADPCQSVRTAWLLLLFALLVGVLGVALAYVFQPSLLIVVAIAGFLYAIFSWFASGSMVGSWTGAQRVEKRDYPQLYRLLENVAIAAGLEQSPSCG